MWYTQTRAVAFRVAQPNRNYETMAEMVDIAIEQSKLRNVLQESYLVSYAYTKKAFSDVLYKPHSMDCQLISVCKSINTAQIQPSVRYQLVIHHQHQTWKQANILRDLATRHQQSIHINGTSRNWVWLGPWVDPKATDVHTAILRDIVVLLFRVI